MSYGVIFTETALNQLRKLERKTQERIITTLERVRLSPERYLRKLRGRPEYRLRVGEYRILILVDREKLILLVVEVGHRKNIYERSGR